MADISFHRALTLTLLALLLGTLSLAAQAETYTALHNFSGPDGASPLAGVTVDAAGNLYGTTALGGFQGATCQEPGCGTVFKLTRRGSGWILSTLYSFRGGTDGAYPSARVVFGPDGGLYGTTYDGSGNSCTDNGCGTVFRLRPPASICASVSCPWSKTILYRFTGGVDGRIPSGDLIFDQVGRIYGTTRAGGSFGSGNVYRLTHSSDGWSNSVLYSFTGGQDGLDPQGGVVFDVIGDLYGTTAQGGYSDPPEYYGAGVVFELTPGEPSWTETVLYKFMDESDGALPVAGLTIDTFGGLYGATMAGGGGNCAQGNYSGCGTVFAGLFFDTVYAFRPYQAGMAPAGPEASLTLNSHDNNLYGTTYGEGAFGYGNVFQLTGGQYVYTSLHDFSYTDGGYPVSSVSFDHEGNFYGTTSAGGTGCPGGCGVIWQITP